MLTVRVAILLITLLVTPTAFAQDCSAIAPTAPRNTDTSVSGKLDAALDGLFAKIANAKADVNGTYHQVSSNVLMEFPHANELYMWERVLFLQCQIILTATDLSSREKIQVIGDLYQKFASPPPNHGKRGSTVINGSGNAVNTGNIGNNNSGIANTGVNNGNMNTGVNTGNMISGSGNATNTVVNSPGAVVSSPAATVNSPNPGR
jgi:hypothetical protein